MFETGHSKSTVRRAALRDKCPDRFDGYWRDLRASGALRSLGIAAGFFALAIAIVMLREDVVPYRPGQYVPQDILSRVDFDYRDKGQLDREKRDARESQPRIYKENGDVWGDLQKNLLDLPERLAGKKLEDVDRSLRSALELDGNTGALSEFLAITSDARERANYEKEVKAYVDALPKEDLIIVPESQYHEEQDKVIRRQVVIQPAVDKNKTVLFPATAQLPESHPRLDELGDSFGG